MACLLSIFTTSIAATIGCLSLAVFGMQLTTSVVWATNADVAPLDQGGRVASIQNCIGNLGGMLAPIVVGILLQATGSWSAPMAAAAIVALAGACNYLFVLSDDAVFARSAAARVPPVARG
jgi:MFS family permease